MLAARFKSDKDVYYGSLGLATAIIGIGFVPFTIWHMIENGFSATRLALGLLAALIFTTVGLGWMAGKETEIVRLERK
jgi:hypothetical protein